MFLGDWGAEIIKVEWWYRMDAWRGMISIDHDRGEQKLYNKKDRWLKLNRNKFDITLNLKTEEGKTLFRRLVKKCDVVADNFSAGVMKRMGLGYDELSEINPRIIVISLPGFGNSGPDAGFVGNGATIQSYAGLASLTGYEDGIPRSSVNIWPDPVAGITGAIAVTMSLIWRERSGKGQFIDLSQAEAVMAMTGEAVLDYTANDRVQSCIGNSDPVMAPHGCYRCTGKDAWITMAVATDKQWEALCMVAGHPEWIDDERFITQVARRRHRSVLDELIVEWTRDEDRWELAERLQKAGVMATPVVEQFEVQNANGLPSTDFFEHTDHPHLKAYPGPAARLNGAKPHIRLFPPLLGEHNDQVYSELLGLSPEDLGKLKEEGII
jgi:benzylsuccinate CoA-transferase BbsF subunit